MRVLHISASDTLSLRQKVLRPGRPFEKCIFINDNHEKTLHLGVIVDEDIVGIGSLFYTTTEKLCSTYTLQIRGMATCPNYRKKGVGKMLLTYMIDYAINTNGSNMWCNARESAVGFYRRAGFLKIGQKFEIEGIGPHYLMSLDIGKLA